MRRELFIFNLKVFQFSLYEKAGDKKLIEVRLDMKDSQRVHISQLIFHCSYINTINQTFQ